jgi:2-oxoglutarate ferredoxin oxidoreductase subunit gamma
MSEGKLYEEIIIAGFGGQGIILAGKLLACAASKAGRKVTYMPSYGAEVRGGTANCMVVISDKMIPSPLITKPQTLIAMNKASLDKFSPALKENGLLIMNTSQIESRFESAKKVNIIAIPADELAVEAGNKKAANMVAIGALLGAKGFEWIDLLGICLKETLSARHMKTLPINIEALKKGFEFSKNVMKNCGCNK